jgi:hypothetical protein
MNVISRTLRASPYITAFKSPCTHTPRSGKPYL